MTIGSHLVTVSQIRTKSSAFLLCNFALICCTSILHGQVPSEKKIQPPKRETAIIDGAKIAYYRQGKGPPCLVPSSGDGTGTELMSRTLKPLEQYFELIFVESRGTGQSDPLKDNQFVTWTRLCSDLEGIRVHLKHDKVWVLGHFDSGIQVMKYAAKYPSHVAGIILFGTPANPRSSEWAKEGIDAINRRVISPKHEAFFKGSEDEKRYSNDAEWKKHLLVEWQICWSDPDGFRQYRPDFEACTVSLATRRKFDPLCFFSTDLATPLKGSQIPTLVLVGDDDTECTVNAVGPFKKHIPKAEIVVLEACGHYPWLESREKTFASIRTFLENQGVKKSTP